MEVSEHNDNYSFDQHARAITVHLIKIDIDDTAKFFFVPKFCVPKFYKILNLPPRHGRVNNHKIPIGKCGPVFFFFSVKGDHPS